MLYLIDNIKTIKENVPWRSIYFTYEIHFRRNIDVSSVTLTSITNVDKS